MRSFILSTFFFLHSICFAGADGEYFRIDGADEETAFEANGGIVTPIDNNAIAKIKEILRNAMKENAKLGHNDSWYINSDGTITFEYPMIRERFIVYDKGTGDRLCRIFLNADAATPKPETIMTEMVGDSLTLPSRVSRLTGERSPYRLLEIDATLDFVAIVQRYDCRIAGLGTPVNRLYKKVEQKSPLLGNSVSIIEPQFRWHLNKYSISADSDLAGVCKGFGYTQYVSAVPAKSINPFAKHVKLDRDGRYVMKRTREFGYLKSIQCEN